MAGSIRCRQKACRPPLDHISDTGIMIRCYQTDSQLLLHALFASLHIDHIVAFAPARPMVLPMQQTMFRQALESILRESFHTYMVTEGIWVVLPRSPENGPE